MASTKSAVTQEEVPHPSTEQGYAESKLCASALALALAWRWPDTLTNVVNPSSVQTRPPSRAKPALDDFFKKTTVPLKVN